MLSLRKTGVMAATISAAALLSMNAYAVGTVNLTAQYFKLPSDHVDVQQNINGLATGLVNTSLGTSGLPVASASALGGSVGDGNSAKFKDLDGSNQLQWWTAGTRTVGSSTFTVTTDGTQNNISSANYDSGNGFYTTGAGGNGGSNGFRSGHYSGTFSTIGLGNGQFSADASGDDDTWMFLTNLTDNTSKLIVDDGGVKGYSGLNSPVIDTLLGGKQYRLDVFFADRFVVESRLGFNFTYNNAPIPEPAFYQMSALLLGGGTMLIRARRRKA